MREMSILPKKMIGKTEMPLICTPLVGATEAAVMAELEQVLVKQPDAIEWRADFFTGIADQAAVIAVVNSIKETAAALPLIFTVRSAREGGQPIPLSDAEVIELCAAVCEQTAAEYVDCELRNNPEHIARLRQAAERYATKLIGSFHHFSCTPSWGELVEKMEEAQRYGLDVAKVAVMPQKLEDVLTLLSATLEAKQRLDIPLITMSMGKYGAVSRLVGGVFGSSLSFAVGANASAPGQVPIEDLRAALEIVDRSMRGAGK